MNKKSDPFIKGGRKMQSQIMKFGKDVDTDQIIGSQYLLLPNIEAMKPYAFHTIREHFVQEVQLKSILVADDNFGCGSSREQAPGVLKALGVECIIARSFARIFFRNAINIGLPVVICEEANQIEEGMHVKVDIEAGKVEVMETKKCYSCTKLPEQMRRILKAGGLLALLGQCEK